MRAKIDMIFEKGVNTSSKKNYMLEKKLVKPTKSSRVSVVSDLSLKICAAEGTKKGTIMRKF